MLHTLPEALALTGISRRTLYNHIDAGRISYSVGNNGRKYFETAELERCYGKLKGIAHSEPETVQPDAHIGTVDNDQLLQLIAEAVTKATEPLLAEIQSLKETLLRIEHKPTATPPEPLVRLKKKANCFADLLENMSD